MDYMELIDKLCHVTTVLSDIVRKQTEIIRQHDIIIDEECEAGKELVKEIDAADSELDLIEYHLRGKIQ